jgi:hypothetical protein
VHIDFFTAHFSGTKYSAHYFDYNLIYRCILRNSGFRFIDFFGEKILAPYDIEASLVETYGPDFLVPEDNLGIGFPCLYMETSLLRSPLAFMPVSWLHGLIINHQDICFLSSDRCKSPTVFMYALNELITEFVLACSRAQVQVIIACDLLKFVNEGAPLPRYAAVIIEPKYERNWSQIQESLLKISTFKLELDETDGSLAHVRYSQTSDVRLVLYTMEWDASTRIEYRNISKLVNVPVAVAENGDIITKFQDICRKCQKCDRSNEIFSHQGALKNVNTNKCLTATARSVCLTDCIDTVCFIIFAIYNLHILNFSRGNMGLRSKLI